MSFTDSQSPFAPPGFSNCIDEFTVSVNGWQGNGDYEQSRPLKRHKEEENVSENVVIVPQTAQRMHSSRVPINEGMSNIFFKTRVCAKFKLGQCRNGEKCNFAHGVEDLRQPPPNWQELVVGREEDRGTGNWDDEQRIALKMKLCKKFSNGEVCPYGDKCNFLHEDPNKYRDDSTRFNVTSGNVSGSELSEFNFVSNCYKMNIRTEHWKTKLCSKFDASGFCTFGDKCGFAHGPGELKGSIDVEIRNAGGFNTSMKSFVAATNEMTSSSLNNVENRVVKDFSKLKGSKKINRIYADWIDDLNLDPSQT